LTTSGGAATPTSPQRRSLPSSRALATICLVLLGLVVAALVVHDQTVGRRCLVAGTRVDTPSGPRLVESLHVGDAVWSQAPDGSLQLGTVTAVYPARASSYLELIGADGRRLRVTAAHPLATARGWVEAGRLRVGDRLQTRAGATPLESITPVFGVSVAVYDLSVSPYPNFFAAGIRVHNKQGRQMRAISNLKQIVTAQQVFWEADKDGDDVLDFAANLHELREAGLIDEVLASGQDWSGYVFSVCRAPHTSEFLWMAVANPSAQLLADDGPSRHAYVVNQNGEIHYRLGDRPFGLDPSCEIPGDAKQLGE